MILSNSDGKPILELADGIKSFDELNLIEPDFSGLELEGASFDACNLVRPNFSNTDLYWVRFYDTNCVTACFKGASLRGADLYQSNFIGADFTNADLNRDNLNGKASFTCCNFQNATLVGADLTGLKHDGTNFKGATYSQRTRFPEGFDPEAAGMIQVDDPQSMTPQKALPY